MKKSIFAQIALMILITSSSYAGREVGEGEPVVFQMPTEDFSYRCEFEFYGRAEKEEPWYTAETTAVFTKQEFEKAFHAQNNNSATVTSLAEDHEWEVQSHYPYKEYDELPAIFHGHELILKMNMKANVLPPWDQNISSEDVVLQAIISTDQFESLDLTSESSYSNFPSKEPFSTTLKIKSSSKKLDVGLRTDCSRIK